jgi:GT2 family glycosyltransferase
MSMLPDTAAQGTVSGNTVSGRVLVTIVNWNTREHLRTCLQTLDVDGHDAVAVVVVDNCSSDGSAAMVTAAFPWVHLIRAPRNLGFAGAVNLGIEHSISDHVLILNPDMRVTREDIARLTLYLEHTPSVAAVSPLLVGDDGRVQTHMYCRFPTIGQVALFWTVLSPLARRITPLRRRLFEHDLRADEPTAVDQLPGAALMISRKALQFVGPLDPGYFIWWEDVDWCYRARERGLSLYVLPDVRCRHAGGTSFVTWNFEARVFQFYRAFYRFLAKHGRHRLARRVRPILLADLFVKAGLIRVLRMLRLREPAGAHSLGDTRRALRDILHGMHRGEVPYFESATTERRHD